MNVRKYLSMQSHKVIVMLLTLLYSEWPKTLWSFGNSECIRVEGTLLHSEWPKLYGVLEILSAIRLKEARNVSSYTFNDNLSTIKRKLTILLSP